jgi:MFS family permease
LNPEEKKTLGVTAVSHGLVHLYEGILPPLIPLLLSTFGTDYLHLGLVVTVFSYAFGLGALPSGYLSDKAGAKRLVVIYLFGAGICSLFVWSIDTLLSYGIFMGLIGLFCSLYHPAANTLISYTFEEKGKAFAINGIAGSLGIAVVPIISAWMGALMGWKVPHIIFGIFGIAVGWLALTLPKQTITPFRVDMKADEETERSKIRYLSLVIFYLTTCLLGITYRGTMTFLPSYMGQNVQLGFLKLNPVAIGGTFATVALVCGGVGQFISGHLVDRYRPEKIYFVVMILGSVWLLMMAGSTNVVLIISSMSYAFFYFATQPVQNYLISGYLPTHRRGLGFGIQFFLAFSVGSTAAAVSGYVADRFGLKMVFYAMGICSLISSFLAGLLLFRAYQTDPKRISGRK